MHALVHAADVQDRDGGVVVMATLFGLYPFLLKLYADGGYRGPTFQKGLKKAIAQVNDRDRQALGSGQGVRRVAQALGRGAHVRMARPLSPPRQGLGVPQYQGARLPQAGLHPPYDPKAL